MYLIENKTEGGQYWTKLFSMSNDASVVIIDMLRRSWKAFINVVKLV